MDTELSRTRSRDEVPRVWNIVEKGKNPLAFYDLRLLMIDK